MNYASTWTRLDAGVPLALLPVRLETRFVGSDLLIRIEPDVLNQDAHVDVLRPDEKLLGQQFWSSVGKSGPRSEAAISAWKTLAAALGPWRAAWVARAVRTGATEGDVRAKPTRARLLPTRWVAKAWFGGRSEVLGWSERVRAPLHVGLDIDDPHWRDDAALSADETAGRLRLDPKARWLTDFDEAHAAGMALRIALDDLPALKQHLGAGKAIDELLVVGVDVELDADSGGQRLNELFEAQRHTQGLELVEPGTPTNNTEQVRTGVSPSSPDLEGLLQRELGPLFGGRAQAAVPLPLPTQGGRLARALGFAREGLVQRLEHAGQRHDEAAAAMNRLLWPQSFGTLFDELLLGVEDPAGTRLVDAATLGPLADWFCTHVRGGGPLPTLRVGAQPFGVLPVRRLTPRATNMTRGALGTHVNDAVALLRDRWREVLPEVATMKAAGGDDDAHATLLKLLGGQPHPWEFTVQRCSDCRELLTSEFGAYNWAAAQHAPMLAGLMPNFRLGEPGRRTLEFVNALFGSDGMPPANTADEFLGMLVCWAKLLCSQPNVDLLPRIAASPSGQIAPLADRLEAGWITSWKLDALRWQEALRGRPVPAIPRTIEELIAYIDWLLGDPVWLVEALKPEGVWGAYLQALLLRKNALDAIGAAARTAGQEAELAFCNRLWPRVTDPDGQSIPTVLREARAALELHRKRVAPLASLYGQWGRGSRLRTHLMHDGPTGAYLAYEDEHVAAWPTNASLVQPQRASEGDRAATFLTELAGTNAWDTTRIGAFADAAKKARKPSDLAEYHTQGMSVDRVPPLLFQLARAALTASSGAEQQRVRQALRTLAGVEPRNLELCLRETLGLVTHRLDAWATGLASEALFAQRVSRPSGIQIGAYGWVEALRRDPTTHDSQGYLLAPSLAHAATAAVLRSGWQAFAGSAGPKGSRSGRVTT